MQHNCFQYAYLNSICIRLEQECHNDNEFLELKKKVRKTFFAYNQLHIFDEYTTVIRSIIRNVGAEDVPLSQEKGLSTLRCAYISSVTFEALHREICQSGKSYVKSE